MNQETRKVGKGKMGEGELATEVLHVVRTLLWAPCFRRAKDWPPCLLAADSARPMRPGLALATCTQWPRWMGPQNGQQDFRIPEIECRVCRIASRAGEVVFIRLSMQPICRCHKRPLDGNKIDGLRFIARRSRRGACDLARKEMCGMCGQLPGLRD